MAKTKKSKSDKVDKRYTKQHVVDMMHEAYDNLETISVRVLSRILSEFKATPEEVEIFKERWNELFSEEAAIYALQFQQKKVGKKINGGKQNDNDEYKELVDALPGETPDIDTPLAHIIAQKQAIAESTKVMQTSNVVVKLSDRLTVEFDEETQEVKEGSIIPIEARVLKIRNKPENKTHGMHTMYEIGGAIYTWNPTVKRPNWCKEEDRCQKLN